MNWRPSREGYGVVGVALHWVMAAIVIGMFVLGEFMTGLDYTHPWYRAAPELHKSFGLLVFALLAFRFLWRSLWRSFDLWPVPVPMPAWERVVALVVHRLFYILILALVVCGYLVPIADGRGIDFFGLFEVPALISGHDGQEDIAGEAHHLLAWAVMALVVLHAMAAMKHHFIEKDETLRRMLGRKTR